VSRNKENKEKREVEKRVEFKDGYVILDGYETKIREERWKEIEKGMGIYKKAFKIAREMVDA
jgi:hypothetical protein